MGVSTNVFRTLRARWKRFVRGLPEWMFAPAPVPIDWQSMGADDGKSISEEEIRQRKKNHYEISKTIGRLFYTLIGTCLFCVITLMSPAHINNNEADVKLPLLNYEVNFDSFLIVGPVIIVGLTIYLHIFVEEYRRYSASPDVNYTMLHDFDSWAPRLAVVAIFYWMVPVTLLVFVWNTTHRDNVEPFLILLTSIVTLGLILLQFRRCPKDIRPRAYLWLFFISASFAATLLTITLPGDFAVGNQSDDRDGAKQVIANTDKQNIEFREKTVFEPGSDLLKGEDLQGADLEGAVLRQVNLENSILRDAVLIDANLREANLKDADLRNANLTGANLRNADLTGVKLQNANLSNADFFGAVMHDADISGVDLSEVKIESYQFGQVCGDDIKSVPNQFSIKSCEE